MMQEKQEVDEGQSDEMIISIEKETDQQELKSTRDQLLMLLQDDGAPPR